MSQQQQQQQNKFREDNGDAVQSPHFVPSNEDADAKNKDNTKTDSFEKQQSTPKYYYFPVEAKALVDQKLGVMHTHDDEFLNQHAAIRFSSNINNDNNYASSDNNNASFDEGTDDGVTTKKKNNNDAGTTKNQKRGSNEMKRKRRRKRRNNIYRNNHEEETDSSGQERKANLKKKLFLAKQMMLLSDASKNNNHENSNFQQQIESSGTEDESYYSYSDDDDDYDDDDEDEFEQFQRLASLAVFRHTTDKHRHHTIQKHHKITNNNNNNQFPKKFFADPFEYEYSEDEDGEDNSSSSEDDDDDDDDDQNVIADDEADNLDNLNNKNNAIVNNKPKNNKNDDTKGKEKTKKKRRSKKPTAFPEELLNIFDDQLRDRQKEIEIKKREFRDAHSTKNGADNYAIMIEMKGENISHSVDDDVDENEKQRRRHLRDEEERIECETPFHIPSHVVLSAGVADQELNNKNATNSNHTPLPNTNNPTMETNNSQQVVSNNNNSSNEKSINVAGAVVAAVVVTSQQPSTENENPQNNKKAKSISSNSKNSGSSRGYYSTLPFIPDWVQDLVYRSILDEDMDTFPAIVRKVAATILLMTGWLPGCFGIWFFVSCRPGPLQFVPEVEAKASEMIGISCIIWGFLLAGLPWLYCRVTKEAPEWLGFANLWMLALNNLVINVGFPFFPSDIVFAVITLGMVLMADSTGWKMASNFFTMSIIFMIVFFNRTFALFTDGGDDRIWNNQNQNNNNNNNNNSNYRNPVFLFTMRNFRRGIAPEHLFFTLTQSITIAAVILLTYSVRQEFSRIMNRIFSNALVGKTIAKKLTSWDMRGIDDEIAKYGKLSHADRLLHRSLSIAVATIEEYSRLVPRRRIRLMKEIFSLDEKMKMLTSSSAQMMMMTSMMMTRASMRATSVVGMALSQRDENDKNNSDIINEGVVVGNSFNSINFVALMDQSRLSAGRESSNNGKNHQPQHHHQYTNDNFFEASVNTNSNNNNNNNSFPNSQRSDNLSGFRGTNDEDNVKKMLLQQQNTNNHNKIPQSYETNIKNNNNEKNDGAGANDDDADENEEDNPNKDMRDAIRFTKNINLVHLSDVTAIHVRILEFDELCDLTCRWRPSVVTEGIRKFQTLFKRRVEQHFGRMLGGATDENNGHCQAVWGGRLVSETDENENEKENKTKQDETAPQLQQQQEAQTNLEGKDPSPSSRPLSPILLPRASPTTPTANLFFSQIQNQNNINNNTSSYSPSSAAAALLQLSHCSKENASTLACLAAMHIYEIAKSVIKPFFDQNLNNKFNFRIQIGIAKGDLFVGSYGSHTRQVYSGEGSCLQIAKSLSYFYDPWIHFKRSGYVHPYEKMRKPQQQQQQRPTSLASPSPSPLQQIIPQQQFDLFFGDVANNNNTNNFAVPQNVTMGASLNHDKNNKEGIVAAVSIGSEENFFPTTSSPQYFGSIYCTEEVIQDANRRISSRAKLMMMMKAEVEKRTSKQKNQEKKLESETQQQPSALDKLFRDFSFYNSYFDKDSQVRNNIEAKKDDEVKMIQNEDESNTNDNNNNNNNNNLNQQQQTLPSAMPDSVVNNGDDANSEDDEDQEEFVEEEEEEEQQQQQQQQEPHHIETKKFKHETQPYDPNFDIADTSGGPEAVLHISNSENDSGKNNISDQPQQRKSPRLKKISHDNQKNNEAVVISVVGNNNTNQASMFSDLHQSSRDSNNATNDDNCQLQHQKQSQKNSNGVMIHIDIGINNNNNNNDATPNQKNRENNGDDLKESEVSAPFGSVRMQHTGATSNLGDSASNCYSDAVDAFRQTPPNPIKIIVNENEKDETGRKSDVKKLVASPSTTFGNTRSNNNNNNDKKPISAAEQGRIQDRKYFYNMTFITRETHPVLAAPFWVDGNVHQLLGFTEFDLDKYFNEAEGRAKNIADMIAGAEVSKRHDDVRNNRNGGGGGNKNNSDQRRNAKGGMITTNDSSPNRPAVPRQDFADSLISVCGASENASSNNNNTKTNKDIKNKKIGSNKIKNKNSIKDQEVKNETQIDDVESHHVTNINDDEPVIADDCNSKETEIHNEIHNNITDTLVPSVSTNFTSGSTVASATPYDVDDNRKLAENVVIARKKRTDVFPNAMFTGAEHDDNNNNNNKLTNDELPSAKVSQNEEEPVIPTTGAVRQDGNVFGSEKQTPPNRKNSSVADQVEIKRSQEKPFTNSTSEKARTTKPPQEPTTTKNEEKQKKFAKKQLTVENRKEFARARIDFAARISSSFRHLVLTSLPVTSLVVSLSPTKTSSAQEKLFQVHQKNEVSGNINNNSNNNEPKTGTNSTCTSSNSTNSGSPTTNECNNPQQQKLQQYLRRNSKYFFIKNHRHRKIQQQQQRSCSFFVSDILHSLNNNNSNNNHHSENLNNDILFDKNNQAQKMDELPSILKNLFAPLLLSATIATTSKNESAKLGNNSNNNNKEKEDEKDLLSTSPLRIIEQINCARRLMDQHDFEKALFTLNEILLTLSPLIPQSFYDHGFTLETVAGMRSDCKMLIDHAACRWIVNPNQMYFQNNNNNNKNKNRNKNNGQNNAKDGQLVLVNNTNDSAISLFENQSIRANRRNNTNHSDANSFCEVSSNQLSDVGYQQQQHQHHRHPFSPQSPSQQQQQHPPYKLVIKLSKILARMMTTQHGFQSTTSVSYNNNKNNNSNANSVRNNGTKKFEEGREIFAGSTRKAMLGPLQSSNLLGRSSRGSNSSSTSNGGSESSRNQTGSKSPLIGAENSKKVDFIAVANDGNVDNNEGDADGMPRLNNNNNILWKFQGDCRVTSITKNSRGLPRNYHDYANKIFGESEEEDDDDDFEDFFGDCEDEDDEDEREGGIFSTVEKKNKGNGSPRKNDKQNIRRNIDDNYYDHDASFASNHNNNNIHRNNNNNNNYDAVSGPNNRHQNLRTLFSCAVSTRIMHRLAPETKIINSLYSRWEQHRQKEEKLDSRLRLQLRNGNFETDDEDDNYDSLFKKRRVDSNVMIFPMPVDVRFWAEDY